MPTLRERLASLVSPRAGLSWLAASRLRMLAAAGVAMAVVGAAVLAGLLVSRRSPPEERVTLAMALEALDLGENVEAGRLAEKVERQGDLTIEEWGGPAFVLGMVDARAAEDVLGKERTAAYLKASRHLEEAQKRGFPEGREAEGLGMLAKSLYQGGRISASRPALQAALQSDPQKCELRGMLAGACMNDTPPDLNMALSENQRYLAVPDLPAPDRDEGLIRQAEILFRLGRTADCIAMLDELPSNTDLRGEAMVLRGRVLRQEAQSLREKSTATPGAKARAKYQAAIEAFRRAQGRDTVSNQATPQAMYLIGLCQLELGDQRAAMAQFGRTNRQFPETPEGLAADFQQAEIARHLGRDAEALTAYRRLLSAVAGAQEFHNPWLTLKELRTALLAARQDYLAAKNFDPAAQMSRLLSGLVPKARATELEADTHRAWGQHLLAEAEGVPRDRAQTLRRDGRAQFRRAGSLYGQLARLEITTRQYPERLWQCATAYLEGHDYRNGARVLEDYLRNNFRKRRPQALVELGESRLALGQWDKALEAFQECISHHPRDAAAYRVRPLAARAWIEKGELKQAETVLQENLGGGTLAPSSQEWRDSLFILGELLHAEGRYAEAIRRLEEAVTRYPDAPQTIQARYLAADALRRTAQTLRAASEKEASSAARKLQAAEVRTLLERALSGYQTIEATLARRDQGEMTPAEKAMLRNSRFALGGVCCDLEQYEEALRAYTAAVNRYADSPEALDGYVQLAGVYRRLERPAEARASLQQAKVALARSPSNTRFQETTNYSRKQWGETLDWELKIAE